MVTCGGIPGERVTVARSVLRSAWTRKNCVRRSICCDGSVSVLNQSQFLGGSFTSGAGRFAIQRLPPGDYLLVVNINNPPQLFPPTYFPGVQQREKATVIHVESGQQLTDFELRLPPPLLRRTITGRVVLSNGKPAASGIGFAARRSKPGDPQSQEL